MNTATFSAEDLRRLGEAGELQKAIASLAAVREAKLIEARR